MAIDTAEKRKSISGIGGPPLIPGVTPVGSAQDQEWRQEAGWSYSGILAGAAVEIARESVVTMFAGLVGTVPAKYRIRIRQSEGSGVIKATAGICQLRATLHARSNLLAADTMVFTPADTYLEQLTPNTPQAARDQMQLRHIDPASQASPLIQFDVSALAGFVWKSVVLRLTFVTGDGQTPPTDPILTRVTRAVAIANATWNEFDSGSSWQTPGGTGANDQDTATAVNWTPYPAQPYATGQVMSSPDLTTIVNDAITLQSGILRLLMRGPFAAFTTQRIWSIEGAADDRRPHLFFDAF